MKIPLLSKVIDPIQATTGPVVQINGDASVHREPNLHYAFPLAPLTIKPSRVPKASDMPLHTLKPLITLCYIKYATFCLFRHPLNYMKHIFISKSTLTVNIYI